MVPRGMLPHRMIRLAEARTGCGRGTCKCWLSGNAALFAVTNKHTGPKNHRTYMDACMYTCIHASIYVGIHVMEKCRINQIPVKGVGSKPQVHRMCPLKFRTGRSQTSGPGPVGLTWAHLDSLSLILSLIWSHLNSLVFFGIHSILLGLTWIRLGSIAFTWSL